MNLKLSHQQIIDLLGGPAKVAKLCKTSTQAVCQWRDGDIPVSRLVFLGALIEKQSHGLVSRKDLFPNNWQMIWPELQ